MSEVKNKNYVKRDGSDLIDRWIREEEPYVVRIKLLAHMEAYQSRYGSKDSMVSEAKKIAVFANRLLEFEESQVKNIKTTEG